MNILLNKIEAAQSPWILVMCIVTEVERERDTHTRKIEHAHAKNQKATVSVYTNVEKIVLYIWEIKMW